ncbi:MAG: acylneuraminate cytidylyltransferase family protein [Lachnospiraceae bacterium]|nr:acylneuraminate cytidylyltransferase family protein [Lachnospiraceae bacterium]
MKIVAFIPIKFNNQRLPGKNIKELGGKPLCKYVFETAKKVHGLDEIYVICSDEKICNYIPEGIKFKKRPLRLDGPLIKSKDILEWFTKEVNADIYVLMHVTQPFIKEETIQTAVEMVRDCDYDSAFAAHIIKEFAWYKNSPINYTFDNVVRTQELEPIYVEGELFIFKKEIFTKYGRRIGFKPYIHPIDWKESICIDEQKDFEMAQMVLAMEKK